ncbi:inorganic phosphate transporter [Natrinema soli]|uniref:Phosphate transporter n=1 Tax=Natrinema soli TaxID=1930624 RepID=A0ABD5SSG5_9EURY|nr:inorganic phosphate transporter [Natrinema soli]
MYAALLSVGLVLTILVGCNIGGSTTGPAFGPAVGANVIGTGVAATLMTVCFALGALTVGPEVVDTLAVDLLRDQSVFTLRSSAAVLLMIGGALLVGNYAGVPASTSMTAVGAVSALGLATGELDWSVLSEIAVWWIVAPIVGFWVAGVVGRYFYPRLDEWLALETRTRDRPMVTVASAGFAPRFRLGSSADRREAAGSLSVIAIGCATAYASGTSNIANAIAPLYATGAMALTPLVLLGSAAVAVGAFTIARRTLETVGSDITELPLTAAIIVTVVSAGLVVFLSWLGIPASFVVIATMSIVGLGWGRATRTTAHPNAAAGGERATPGDDGDSVPAASDLFDPATTARVLLVQNIVPVVATVGTFVLFQFGPLFEF